MAVTARRSWTLAVAAAAGAHVLLSLIPIMDAREGTAATPPVVHLRLAGASPQPAPAPAPPAPAARAANEPAEDPTPEPGARGPARPVRDQRTATPLETEATEPIPPEPATRSMPAPAGLPDGLSTEPPPGPTRDGAVAVDRDRARYAALVRRAVDAQKQYPRRARRMNRQGVARIDVTIAPSGELSTPPALAASSGWESLDREALRMARAAAPFPHLPRSLGDAAISIRLPVHFSLD